MLGQQYFVRGLAFAAHCPFYAARFAVGRALFHASQDSLVTSDATECYELLMALRYPLGSFEKRANPLSTNMNSPVVFNAPAHSQ